MASNVQGTVYLIHFDEKLSHAQHYIGWASNLEGRLAHHKRGTGSRLMAAVSGKGIKWAVARTWSADRNFERKLKNQKNASKLCPVCRAAAEARKAAGE